MKKIVLVKISPTLFIIQPFYMPNKIPAILKYISKEQASTIVVINGDAITAGSNPILFASIGSKLPISFAITIVTTNVKHTTAAILNPTLSM